MSNLSDGTAGVCPTACGTFLERFDVSALPGQGTAIEAHLPQPTRGDATAEAHA